MSEDNTKEPHIVNVSKTRNLVVPPEERYINKSLYKALLILELFDHEAGELSATEIAKRLGTLPGTIYPTLMTLERFGYLARDENKKYALGLKLLERANLVLRRLDLRDVAQTTLQQVATTHNVNAHLAVLYDGSVMYLQREEGYPSVIIKEVIGQRVPAYCTALGKVLLAALSAEKLGEYIQSTKLVPLTPYTITSPDRLRGELKVVRKQGYAVDNEEFHEGSLCIAAPIFDYRGNTIAATSLSLPKPLVAGGRLMNYVAIIRDAARRISSDLGYKEPE